MCHILPSSEERNSHRWFKSTSSQGNQCERRHKIHREVILQRQVSKCRNVFSTLWFWICTFLLCIYWFLEHGHRDMRGPSWQWWPIYGLCFYAQVDGSLIWVTCPEHYKYHSGAVGGFLFWGILKWVISAETLMQRSQLLCRMRVDFTLVSHVSGTKRKPVETVEPRCSTV